MIEEYGEDFWRELAVSSHQDRGFEALLIYDDTVARWLMAAAVRRLNCIGAKDCMARIGGDEFLLFFVRIADSVFLQRIAAHLEKPARFDQHVCCISASAGTSISIDYPNPDPDVMLSGANRALYASKKAGCGQHRFAKDHQSGLSQH